MSDRRFPVLLGLSLLMHLAGLAWFAGRASTPPAALPTLMASLRQIVVADTQAPAARPLPAAAAPVPKARQSSSAMVSRSVPSIARAAEPTRQNALAVSGASARTEAAPSAALPLPRLPAATEALAQATASPAASPTVSGAAAASASAAPAAAAPRENRSPADLLAAYRARLGQLFAGRQEYPRMAALRGWEGEVLLRLTVARKGNLIAVQLDRSSGFEVLDRSALAFVEALAGLPPLPEALEANEIQVVVPVHYKLRKTT